MPGGSKKGGGLTVKKSALYKKQKFSEAKSPFIMKSPLHRYPKSVSGTVRQPMDPGTRAVERGRIPFRQTKNQ